MALLVTRRNGQYRVRTEDGGVVLSGFLWYEQHIIQAVYRVRPDLTHRMFVENDMWRWVLIRRKRWECYQYIRTDSREVMWVKDNGGLDRGKAVVMPAVVWSSGPVAVWAWVRTHSPRVDQWVHG